jgi:hypothetical protein
MAKTVGLFGQSGEGKSTSIVINPDGSYNPAEYLGMNPKSTVIFNSDRKDLPFPSGGQWVEGRNVFSISDNKEIKAKLKELNAIPGVKSAYIDTVNGIMLDREMSDKKKMSYDRWADLAYDIYDLISFCNNELRGDMIVYLSGHVTVFTDVDGNEAKCLVTNGRKLEKIKLESKLPIVLFTNVSKGAKGKNTYQFETQSNRSTAKSPIGMFEDFLIPNSLKLVDDTIRTYYGM